MKTKTILMMTTVAVLVGVYVRYFTDWFQRPTIQIMTQIQHLQGRNAAQLEVYPVVFGLSHKYPLTKVKVVPLKAFQANKNAPAVWYMIQDTNTPPVRAFTYGKTIPGMKPYNRFAPVQTLKPNVAYHLIVEAGGIIGETNFIAQGPVQLTASRSDDVPPPPPSRN